MITQQLAYTLDDLKNLTIEQIRDLTKNYLECEE